MSLISNNSRKERPAAETQAHAERIVRQVRAEVARNPEFAPFADRPASDMRRMVRSAEPVSVFGWLRAMLPAAR